MGTRPLLVASAWLPKTCTQVSRSQSDWVETGLNTPTSITDIRGASITIGLKIWTLAGHAEGQALSGYVVIASDPYVNKPRVLRSGCAQIATRVTGLVQTLVVDGLVGIRFRILSVDCGRIHLSNRRRGTRWGAGGSSRFGMASVVARPSGQRCLTPTGAYLSAAAIYSRSRIPPHLVVPVRSEIADVALNTVIKR